MEHKYVIVKNVRREYKELHRSNRVFSRVVTTWDVVDDACCRFISDHHTKREAVAKLDALTKETK